MGVFVRSVWYYWITGNSMSTICVEGVHRYVSPAREKNVGLEIERDVEGRCGGYGRIICEGRFGC